MKLIATKTGHRTNLVTGTDDDDQEIAEAQDRLVARLHPGHFASRKPGQLNHVEVCRAVSGMTEHTGVFMDFEISE